jgi:hypothetical protein
MVISGEDCVVGVSAACGRIVIDGGGSVAVTKTGGCVGLEEQASRPTIKAKKIKIFTIFIS